jgi:hypothetical protein
MPPRARWSRGATEARGESFEGRMSGTKNQPSVAQPGLGANRSGWRSHFGRGTQVSAVVVLPFRYARASFGGSGRLCARIWRLWRSDDR